MLIAEASSDPLTLIVLGLFLLAGFVANVLGRRVKVPRVTLLLLLGFLAGPSSLALIPPAVGAWFPLAAQFALSMIGFQLGEQFLGKRLRRTGKLIAVVSLTESVGTTVVVFTMLWLAGVPLAMAVLLAGIAPTTAPAATLDVVREYESKGPVTDTVLGVVAVDDAWGVMLFSILMVIAGVAAGGEEVSSAIVLRGVWELAGGILLGIAFGWPMAMLTGRICSGELTLVETLGFVFLCSGTALYFELSYLMACMAMGATVSNVAKHHDRPFHAIEEVEQPFMILFFLLAGVHLEFGQLLKVGWIGVGYVAARSFGKIVSASVGATIAKAPPVVRHHVGWCLLPQAGVALGLGLMVADRYPDVGSQVLTAVVGTTFVFEIFGTIATRLSLQHAGEIGSDRSD